MAIDKTEAENLLKKWQVILRLQDWDIIVEIVEKKWRKSGDIKIEMDLKEAVLMLNANPVCTNLEEVIIHELIHLKLWSMDQMIERLIHLVYGTDEKDPKYSFVYDQFMTTLESTTEDFTKSFLELKGNQKKLGFGRLEKEVVQELEKT